MLYCDLRFSLYHTRMRASKGAAMRAVRAAEKACTRCWMELIACNAPVASLPSTTRFTSAGVCAATFRPKPGGMTSAASTRPSRNSSTISSWLPTTWSMVMSPSAVSWRMKACDWATGAVEQGE